MPQHLGHNKQKTNQRTNQMTTIADYQNQFPQLTGTEKQIAWAEKLRESFCKDYLKISQIDKEEKEDCMEAVCGIKAAKFWIDNADLIKRGKTLSVAKNVFSGEHLETRARQAVEGLDDLKSNLPQLMGTEKQIAWAEKLRLKFLDFAFQEYGRGTTGGLSKTEKQIILDKINLAVSAKWWIDLNELIFTRVSTVAAKDNGCELVIGTLKDL